jgi:hypothetical protein
LGSRISTPLLVTILQNGLCNHPSLKKLSLKRELDEIAASLNSVLVSRTPTLKKFTIDSSPLSRHHGWSNEPSNNQRNSFFQLQIFRSCHHPGTQITNTKLQAYPMFLPPQIKTKHPGHFFANFWLQKVFFYFFNLTRFQNLSMLN